MKLISIPASESVLVVEVSLARRHWFLSRPPRAFLTANSSWAIELTEDLAPTIFLDFDLAPGITSEPVAHFLAATNYRGPVFIHSQNDFGR
jgi:hypothetical protein